MWTAQFWKAAGERAFKTFLQAWVAYAITAQATGLLDFGWKASFSVAGLSTLLSVASSIGSSALTDSPGPSLTEAEFINPEPIA